MGLKNHSKHTQLLKTPCHTHDICFEWLKIFCSIKRAITRSFCIKTPLEARSEAAVITSMGWAPILGLSQKHALMDCSASKDHWSLSNFVNSIRRLWSLKTYAPCCKTSPNEKWTSKMVIGKGQSTIVWIYYNAISKNDVPKIFYMILEKFTLLVDVQYICTKYAKNNPCSLWSTKFLLR